MSRQLSNATIESTRQSTLVSAKSVQKPIVSTFLQSSQQKSAGYKQTSSLRNNVRTGLSSFDNECEKDYYNEAQKRQIEKSSHEAVSDKEDKEMARYLKTSAYLNISEGLINGFNESKNQMSKNLKDSAAMSIGEQVCRKQLMQRHLSAIEAMELFDLNVDQEVLKQAMDQLFEQNVIQPPNKIEVWASSNNGLNMVAGNVKKHPLILWAQRDNVLFLTLEVEDMKIDKLVCEGNKFFISGTNGSGKESYEADLEFYAPIKGAERRQIETARHVELVFPKETEGWWPRLLKESIKVPWLKVDFNKWIDEDEVDEEAAGGAGGFDFSNMNFPGANMLGGLGGDDQEDESDSEGEDNGEIPPLEDVDGDAAEKPIASASASSSTA